MTETPAQPPQGWYPDPADAANLRWWNGQAWTDQVRPAAAASAVPAVPQSSAVTGPVAQPAGQVTTAAGGGTLHEASPAEIGAAPAQYNGPPIIIVTTNDIPGYRVVEVYGEVFGLTVRARNAFSNIGASFRTMFGGEVKGYTTLLAESRYEAVERLKFAAHATGANAVLAMRFDTGEIADLMNEVAAYGTAVRVEKIVAE